LLDNDLRGHSLPLIGEGCPAGASREPPEFPQGVYAGSCRMSQHCSQTRLARAAKNQQFLAHGVRRPFPFMEGDVTEAGTWPICVGRDFFDTGLFEKTVTELIEQRRSPRCIV